MTVPRPADPVGDLDRAWRAADDLVAGLRDGDWSTPTGCPGWSVRDLLDHVVTGNLGLAAALREDPPPPPGDHLGADPRAAWRASGEQLRAAVAAPGALERVVTVPMGTVPAAVALHLRLTELLVHGWDLARATGASTAGLPADLAEQELAFSRVQLERLPPDRRPFAPPQPVLPDAPAVDRLAALLGRPVTPTDDEEHPR